MVTTRRVKVYTIPGKPPVAGGIGYTPVNRAGDSMSGQLAITATLTDPLVRLRQNGSGSYWEARNSSDAIVARLLNNTRLAIGTASTPSAQIHVKGDGVGTAVPTAILQAIASQSSNLLEFRDSAGAVMTSINAGGRMSIDSGTSSGTNLTLTRNNTASANIIKLQGLHPGGRTNISWYDEFGNPLVFMSCHGLNDAGHLAGTPFHIEWYTSMADETTMLPRFDIDAGVDWAEVSTMNSTLVAGGHDVAQYGLLVRRGGSGNELVELNRPHTNALGSNRFYRNLDAVDTAGPLMFLHQDHATDDQPALRIRQDGAGDALVVQDNAGTNRVRVVSTGRVGMGYASAPLAQLHVQPTTDTVGIIAQAVVTQTADLFQVRDVSGTVLAQIGVNGTIRGGVRVTPERTASVKDEFTGGGTTSGTVGELGWFFVGGSVTMGAAAVAGRPGIMRRDTSATAATYAYTRLANTSVGQLTPADTFDATFIARLNQADTDTLCRIGLGADASANPPTDGLYLEKLAADTNWHAVSRAAGVETRTAMAAVGAGAWIKVRLRRVNGTTLGITLDSAAEVTFTTNIPTVALNPFFAVHNAVAASKTLDVDWFDLLVTGISR